MYFYMPFYISIMYLFIYLNLRIGSVVGRPIPLKNIWRELEMQILNELLKSQIKIKQMKKGILQHRHS